MTVLEYPYQLSIERKPDKQFSTFDSLYQEVYNQHATAVSAWHYPNRLYAVCTRNELRLKIEGDAGYRFTHWSFGQLCRLLAIDKQILLRLAPATAATAINDLLLRFPRPLYVDCFDETIRAFHLREGQSIHDVQILSMIIDLADDLTDPKLDQVLCFRGDRDMVVFLVDSTVRKTFDDHEFLAAIAVWNSEVGEGSLGVQSGWYHLGSGGVVVESAGVANAYLARRHNQDSGQSLSLLRDMLGCWNQSTKENWSRMESLLANAHSQPTVSPEKLTPRLRGLRLTRQQVGRIKLKLAPITRQSSLLDLSLQILAATSELDLGSSRLGLGRLSFEVLCSNRS